MAHDWNEMVSITLPKNGDLVTKVTVNGKTYEIERGKPTKVPYPVYERLQLMLAFDQTPPAKVPQSSGGGIKTAIFKQGGLDGLLAGETVDYTTSLFCKNMTRDEAIQTIMSGEPLDVIYMTYEGAEDSISSIKVRRINDCIDYNILKDKLYVGNGAIWMEDGELAWPAE